MKTLKSKIIVSALAIGILPLALISTTTFANIKSTPTGYTITNNTPYVLTVQVGAVGDQHGNFYCNENNVNYENNFTVPRGGSCNIGFTTDSNWMKAPSASGTIQLWYGYSKCYIYYNNNGSNTTLTYNFVKYCNPAQVNLTNGGQGGITVTIPKK